MSTKAQDQVTLKLNEENISLYKQITEMKKMNAVLNGDILLKNQIIEDNNV